MAGLVICIGLRLLDARENSAIELTTIQTMQRAILLTGLPGSGKMRH